MAVEAAASYEDAKAFGADESTARWAALFALPGGASEAVPISRMFDRVDKATGGGMKKVMFRMLTEGFEEAVQEFGQNVWSNTNARHILGYDPNRKLLEGAFEGGAAGGVAGMLMSVIMTGMGLGKGMRRRRKARKLTEKVRKGLEATREAEPEPATAPEEPIPPEERKQLSRLKPLQLR